MADLQECVGWVCYSPGTGSAVQTATVKPITLLVGA